jgi:hypothetical protein
MVYRFWIYVFKRTYGEPQSDADKEGLKRACEDGEGIG